jgi:chromosomal replication initiation ATPase DnaA
MQGTEPFDQRDRDPHLIALTRATVAHVFDVGARDMQTKSRQPRAALARQVAMYLGHVVLGMSIAELAGAFGRERCTVYHAVRHVEDLREDTELDRTVLYLECLVRRATEEGA